MILTRLTGWVRRNSAVRSFLLFTENAYGTKRSIKCTAKSQHISALNGIEADQCAEIQAIHTKGRSKKNP